MSHFAVMIVGAKNREEIEQVLYPYWELDLSREDMEIDPRAVFKCKLTQEEAEEEHKKILERTPNQEQIDFAHQELLRVTAGVFGKEVSPINQKKYEEYCEQEKLDSFFIEERISKERYSSFIDWMEDWHGYYYNEEYKSWGYYCNPNAKWDWHQIGGRWAGYFRLKEGKEGIKGDPSLLFKNEDRISIIKEPLICDIAQRKDIDFEGMVLENISTAKKNWDSYKRKLRKCKDDEDKIKKIKTLAFFEKNIYKDDTRKSYIKRQSSFATFALIKDGQWYERGNMGWWGCVTDEKDDWDEKFMDLFEELDDEEWLAIVDCHI